MSTLDTSAIAEEDHDQAAKLSPILLNRTKKISFSGDPRPPLTSRASAGYGRMSALTGSAGADASKKDGRRRRSSSLVYTEPPESLEQISDQAANPNLNANWVNAKGAWAIHFVLIMLLKLSFDILPFITQETSWTLTNISYMAGSYIMFHYVRGVPFDFNAGAYDNLNMWEQIDNGDQYTPAKKFLLAVPVGLFLVSTHYTHYDGTYFLVNFLATLAVVVPKLPAAHRLRFGLFSGPPDDTT